MNTFINMNWRAAFKELGPTANNALGLSIHRIFREAATTVPYKDIFDDAE
jgi:hypothetical protein